jgi:hypothetical protein
MYPSPSLPSGQFSRLPEVSSYSWFDFEYTTTQQSVVTQLNIDAAGLF